MKKNLKIAKPNNKGITLIALVVTIVVLLILAGITITAVLSDGGIFNTAKRAQTVQDEAAIKEKVQIMLADAQLVKLVKNKTLQAYFEEQGYTATEDETAGTIKVAVDGYEATINESTLEITKIEKFIPVAVTGVSFKQSSGTVILGSNLTLGATVTPENASNKKITYTSSNPEVATVNNGVIQGLTEGTTTITATTADGSFTATCNITVSDATIVSTNEELATAVQTAGNVIAITGELEINNNTRFAENVTIIGIDNTSALKMALSANRFIDGAENLTLENLKFIAPNATYTGFTHIQKQQFKNCTIEGFFFLYAANVDFENCVFNGIGNNNYCIWTYGASEATFTNCTFNAIKRALNIYNEQGSGEYIVNINNCKFYASETENNTAAVIVKSLGASYIININNSTATGFGENEVSGSTLWGIKYDNVQFLNNIVVNLDETQVYPVTEN